MTKNTAFNMIMQIEKNNKFSLKQETNSLKNNKTIIKNYTINIPQNKSRNPPMRHVRRLRW